MYERNVTQRLISHMDLIEKLSNYWRFHRFPYTIDGGMHASVLFAVAYVINSDRPEKFNYTL